VDRALLVKDVKPEFSNDIDYLVSMLDWEKNVNPEFAKSNKTHPRPVRPCEEMEAAGYRELWITYRTPFYSAKELTIEPKRSVTIHDSEAYGVIVTQGYGRIAGQPLAAPTMIRFGQMTEDEVFVTGAVAREGVRIDNLSSTDPLVMLKHFGPNNPDAVPLLKK